MLGNLSSLRGSTSNPAPRHSDADVRDLGGWASLTVVDYSAGEDEIAKKICEACERDGFFVLINHPISRERIIEAFGLGERLLTETPEAELMEHTVAKLKTSWFGYIPFRTTQVNRKGTPACLRVYNVGKPGSPAYPPLPSPSILREGPSKTLLADISGDCYAIGHRILRLMARAGGVDAEKLLGMHRFEESSGCHLRYLQYPPERDPKDEAEDPRRIMPHTDFGTLTLLFSQPVSGLQILQPDGEWRYVEPSDYGPIVCNVGDILMSMTGGKFQSTWHTVRRPVGVQKDCVRYSMIYFIRPEDDCIVQPLVPFPESETRPFKPIKFETWHHNKIRSTASADYRSDPEPNTRKSWRKMLEAGYPKEDGYGGSVEGVAYA